MSAEEFKVMIEAEEERLGLYDPEFLKRHFEIMEEIERIRQREEVRKEEQARQKQVLNVHDVMAALEVSESKAYNVIKKLNQELEAKGYITIRGKISRVYFEERAYGIRAASS